MSIRPIGRTELDRFVAFSGDDAENERFGADVERALRAKETSPRWCLICVRRRRDRRASVPLASRRQPGVLHLFDLDWSRPEWRAVGADLIDAIVDAVQQGDERTQYRSAELPMCSGPWVSSFLSMAVKAHEEAGVYPRLRRLEIRRRQDDERIAAHEIGRDERARECFIVEKPRWFEDLARPPYEPRENGVAELVQR